MSNLVLRILDWINRCPTSADDKYHQAMKESDDVLRHMSDGPRDPASEMVADIMSNRHNAPYIATVYQAVQELNAPIKQRLNGSGQ